MVTEFALEILLKIIRLARSTYYYHLKQLDQTDKNQTIKAEIQAIFTEHKGNYGYRRITLALRNRGFVVNHKKVQRLMKALGLSARIRRKRKYSSYQGEIGKKAENEYLRAENNAVLKRLRELRLRDEKEQREKRKLFEDW